VEGEKLEKIQSCDYWGTSANSSADYCSGIKILIEKARASLMRVKKLLCRRDLSLDLGTRMLKCYVFPVLLYGVEAWTLNVYCERKLEAYKMRTYRRMMRIPCTEHVTNVKS